MQDPVEFGEYRLVKRLAISSMSEVFLAYRAADTSEVEPVIVKRLLEDVASVDTFVNLFHNEADIASSMDHPNVVRFLEFGEVEGRLYLVMEHVDGLDLWRLSRRLKRSAFRMAPRTAIHIAMQILDALAYLHALGGADGERLNIVHHDVSPSNVLIARSGDLKLGDFGIAYSEQRELMNLGRKFKGKVHYLSPEQVRGDPVDQRSDLYSACVVLTELLLGRRPFDGPTDLSVIINVRDGHSPVLAESRTTLPPALAEILDRGLAADPSERYQDARAFRDALTRVLTEDEISTARDDLRGLLDSVLLSVDGAADTRRPRPKSSLHAAPPPGRARGPAHEIPEEPFDEIASRIDARSTDERTPATPIKDVSRYTVQKFGGDVMGSMSLSEIIEGIVCGRIAEEDRVSVNGSTFSTVSSIPELSKHLPTVTPTERVHDLGLPDRRGLLEETSVVEVFKDMYVGEESGLLLFECSTIRKDVFLEKGAPRYVTSNLASELLGEYLVRRGIISRMELDMALAVLDRFDGHLGDTLLGLDVLDSISLLRSITSQVKDRLFDIYTWRTGEFHFYRNADASPRGFRLSVPALELIKEGCLHGLAAESMSAWYRANEHTMLEMDPDAAIPLDDWKFSTSYAILLSELSRPRTLGEIMKPYERTSEEVRDKLLAVLRFGIVVGLLRTR